MQSISNLALSILECNQLKEEIIQLEKQLKTQLINKVNSKDTLVYGYTLPRKLSDQPVLIPSDLIDTAKINWKESSIEAQGLSFSSVYVQEPNSTKKQVRTTIKTLK